jgi:hypothetical protein
LIQALSAPNRFFDMSEHDLNVLLFGTACRLRLEPMVLDLAQAFGTSHSKTTQRTNALVTVSIGDVSGYGESGLPPKKRGIYLAGANETTSAVLFMQRLVSSHLPPSMRY